MDFIKAIIIIIYSTLVAIYAMIIVSTILGLVFTFVWNYIIPNLLGLPSLTYTEGIGIIFLVRILINNGITLKSEPKNGQKD